VGEALPILFEDEHLLVVSKPSGLLSVGAPGPSGPKGKDGGGGGAGRTIAQVLAEHGIAARPVHRLDRDVSGCVLCARDERTGALLEDLFRRRELEKSYWALAQGHPKPPAGELKYPILEMRAQARVSAAGKPSVTRYRTLRSFRAASEMEIELVTGRYNQIRLHFAHAGWPLAGERKYARGREDRLRAKRVALHARRLAFAHPHTGRRVEVEAPLPEDLEQLLRRAEQLP
jgi:23S rRNA pseudouridine1911/1915/1917 synthase